MPALASSVIGVGGAYVTYPAPAHLLRGGASLDRQAGLPAGFGNGATTGALLLHEVGHVLGLGHETVDLLQVMHPALTGSTSGYGVTDGSLITHEMGHVLGLGTAPYRTHSTECECDWR